ncbi:ABC transporter-like protein [Cordyceps fumosorosea ARSEF 2679]|uniref:ABC transporter-like protein n=1 Tax=Cordyceps fumosorosea (strain ARSEF 2679) TaxID=1081104 RepID=A0A168BUM6_CORFA|nr:ABC transporter-like protein [Cordyceps fumosorosea ARSEF 2679]OAA70571.1 ABC transporter-like protein [Cordyceps fumosorosea ARSEF 2679]
MALGHSWLGIRLGAMGSMFVAAVTAATVLSKGTASSTGLAITLALQLRQALTVTIGQINVTRTGLNAIDRVLALASVPSEDGEEEASTPENWPGDGRVEMHRIGVQYGKGLPWALNEVSFSLPAGKRLGIVGRTGAGKSSLINALLRFVDVAAGEILIDGQDISQVPRNRVRDAIRVIPQDAFLFSGTLRSNVDVFGKHRDDRIITALRSVHFAPFEQEGEHVIAADLDHEILAGGSNISHGQRQLVCLARAILEDSCRILVLDEATSGIDHATETAIQQTIRGSFRGITVLVVAHKVLTVADFDSILVLKQGKVVENGAPQQLLAANGEFYNMVEKSEDSRKIKELIWRNK